MEKTLAEHFAALEACGDRGKMHDARDEILYNVMAGRAVAHCLWQITHAKERSPGTAAIPMGRLYEEEDELPRKGYQRLKQRFTDEGIGVRVENLPGSDTDDWACVWHLTWPTTH